MGTAEQPERDQHPGSPGHERFPGVDRPEQMPVDAATWGRVREGQHVVSATGERLGRVRQKSDYVFMAETPEGLLTTRELYAPHMAVSRIDGDTVHLAMTKDQLVEAYEHYRRYHFGRPPAGRTGD